MRFDVDTGKGTLNSFSYYYYIVSDFGIVFGSVVVYFFGLFCGYVQKKINRNTSNLGYKLFFFITIILIICTPRDLITIWKTVSLAYLISLIFIIFGSKKIQI